MDADPAGEKQQTLTQIRCSLSDASVPLLTHKLTPTKSVGDTGDDSKAVRVRYGQ